MGRKDKKQKHSVYVCTEIAKKSCFCYNSHSYRDKYYMEHFYTVKLKGLTRDVLDSNKRLLKVEHVPYSYCENEQNSVAYLRYENITGFKHTAFEENHKRTFFRYGERNKAFPKMDFITVCLSSTSGDEEVVVSETEFRNALKKLPEDAENSILLLLELSK